MQNYGAILLWGRKDNEPDYAEQLLLAYDWVGTPYGIDGKIRESLQAKIDDVKHLASRDGFGHFRVGVHTDGDMPDFASTVNI